MKRKNLSNALWIAVAWILLIGSVYVVIRQPNSPEMEIPIRVLKTDVDKAKQVCSDLGHQAGSTIGQVALYNNRGQHFSIPCSAILDLTTPR